MHSCDEGYACVEDFGPEEYADCQPRPIQCRRLAAINPTTIWPPLSVFRQYIEGKIDEDHVKTVEETIIGYRNPDVNNGDAERDAACKAAFEDRFPGELFVEREIEEVTI